MNSSIEQISDRPFPHPKASAYPLPESTSDSSAKGSGGESHTESVATGASDFSRETTDQN